MNIRVLLAAYLPIPVFLADLLYTRFVESGSYPGSLWHSVSAETGLLKWAAVALTCVLIARTPGTVLTLKERAGIVMGGMLASILLFALFVPLVDVGSIRGLNQMILTGSEDVALFAFIVFVMGGIPPRERRAAEISHF